MVKVLNPLRLKFASKKTENNTPKIFSVKNEVESLKALKKELDDRNANYKTSIVVI